jgi:ferrous iron transport protein B
MAPFMSCGARLPVYALFAAAFFPSNGQNVIFGLYLIGIAAAVVTGIAMKGTLLRGESTPFVMELPPYRLPTLKGVALHTWERTKGFVVGAGRLIVPMVLVLNLLGGIGSDLSFGNKDTDRSLLAEVGRTLAPAFAPLGLDSDNWPAIVGIVTGVLAKEAVVGTLDATYSALAEADSGGGGETQVPAAPYSLSGGLAAALASVPANLAKAVGAWSDPLGLADPTGSAEVQAVGHATFGAMAARFDGTVGAFAYLLFILLYAPCVAATSAVYRETGPRWTVFTLVWTTGLGYLVATLFYQTATFARDPVTASAWIGTMLGLFAAALLGLRLAAARAAATPDLSPGPVLARGQGGPQ